MKSAKLYTFLSHISTVWHHTEIVHFVISFQTKLCQQMWLKVAPTAGPSPSPSSTVVKPSQLWTFFWWVGGGTTYATCGIPCLPLDRLPRCSTWKQNSFFRFFFSFLLRVLANCKPDSSQLCSHCNQSFQQKASSSDLKLQRKVTLELTHNLKAISIVLQSRHGGFSGGVDQRLRETVLIGKWIGAYCRKGFQEDEGPRGEGETSFWCPLVYPPETLASLTIPGMVATEQGYY